MTSRIAALALVLMSAASLVAQPAPVARIGDDIEVRRVAPDVYVVTHSFPWPANSMLVVAGEHDLLMVDTPYTPEATARVLEWIAIEFGERAITEINTGYHFDNLGGNEALAARGASIIGSDRTAQLIGERWEAARTVFLALLGVEADPRYRRAYEALVYSPPVVLFPLERGLTLTIGEETVRVIFPGETHAPDDVVVYLPGRRVLFGGCMLLAGTGTGNTSDANLGTWAAAVASLSPLDADVVIPGHGLRFDRSLIANTLHVLDRAR